jgi:hypothetical protein
MSVFGNWLQKQMDGKGWDQRAASVKFRVRESSVHNWLHQDKKPAMKSVFKIALALGVSVDEVARQAGYDDIPETGSADQGSVTRTEILAALPQFEDLLDIIARKSPKEQQVYIGFIRRLLLSPLPPGNGLE